MAYALPQRFVLDQAVEGRAQGDSIAFAFAVAVAVDVYMYDVPGIAAFCIRLIVGVNQHATKIRG